MATSVILDVLGFCGPARVSRADGARLRQEIERLWESNAMVVLDFGSTLIASVSFLDEGIAVLALKIPLADLNETLSSQNITDQDARLLLSLLDRAARQRSSGDLV